MSLKRLLTLIVFFSVCSGWTQENEKIDSIPGYIDKAKNLKDSPKEATQYLQRASQLVPLVKNDSLKTAFLIKIGYRYLTIGNNDEFRKFNTDARNLSMRIKDTMQLAETFWDLGAYYSNVSVYDSAYYAYNEAKEFYSSINNGFYEGRMMLNMGITQSKSEDYTGSEITTIRALEVLKPFQENRQLYGCYNNLGIIYNELDDMETSLYYHHRALDFLDGVPGRDVFEIGTLNNIGVVYERNQNFPKALEYYQKALAVQTPEKMRKDQYAMLLDNITYIRFKLREQEGVEENFLKALHIRDSLDDHFGQAVNKIHLAEFYLNNQDSARGLSLLKENYTLTKSTKNFRDLLKTLKLLTLVDKDHSTKHAMQFIHLSDSLKKAERLIRNKFIRIRYETDEIQHRTLALAKVNQRLWWIGGLLLLLLTSVFVIRAQNLKNKNLEMERSQQASNEEIYAVMLNQQQQIQEVKNEEKRRISEELHDGVLGKLFGTRLLLDTINRNTDEESILLREKHIQDLQEIEEEVRNVSHELNEKSFDIKEGYIQMIENLVKDQAQVGRFKYHISMDVDWQLMESSLKMNVFRILQEATQNINKYAKAKNVWIKFEQEKKSLLFTIIDDGVGFDVERKKKGIGLKNITSRVTKLSGNVKFNSEINRGTEILIEIPF